jgi:hypothetical protein
VAWTEGIRRADAFLVPCSLRRAQSREETAEQRPRVGLLGTYLYAQTSARIYGKTKLLPFMFALRPEGATILAEPLALFDRVLCPRK